MRACGAARVSRRRGDGVQVLHQALEVGHLLGQLVRLVALGERNRVTAGGGGGAGGEGGKHLEGEREAEGEGGKKRGSRGGRGSVRESFAEDTGESHGRGMRRAGGEGGAGGRGQGVRETEEAKTFRTKEKPMATNGKKQTGAD